MSYLSTISALAFASASAAPLALAEAAATDDASRLKGVLAEIADAQRQLSSIIDKIRKDIETISESDPSPLDDGLDATIDFLLTLEQSRATEHDRVLQLATALIARAKELPSDSGILMADVARLAANIHKAYLEALRDTRWDLMARRAAIAPSPDEADDSPDLDTYLSRLLGV